MEAQRRKEASHACWACSPALQTLLWSQRVPATDPAAQGALLSAAAGLHKGRLCTEKFVRASNERIGFHITATPKQVHSASFIFLMAPTGKTGKRKEATARNRSQTGLAGFCTSPASPPLTSKFFNFHSACVATGQQWEKLA